MSVERMTEKLSQRTSTGISREEFLAAILSTADELHLTEQEVYNTIDEALERNYYCVAPVIWKLSSADTSVLQFRKAYIQHTNILSIHNRLIPPKPRGGVRVITYNVHFWTDPFEVEINHRDVVRMTKTLQPDIFGLQEALIPGGQERDSHSSSGWTIKNTFVPLRKMQYIVEGCRASKVASRGKTGFGNILAVSTRIPFLHSESMILPGQKEARCAVIGSVNLFGKEVIVAVTHLDVADKSGRTRRTQMHSLLEFLDSEYVSKPKMIMGDFNCLRYEDYTPEEREWLDQNSRSGVDYDTIREIEDQGYRDLFAEGCIKFTAWTGRRVDYIFVKDFPFKIASTQVFYTSISDHLPLIVDLLPE